MPKYRQNYIYLVLFLVLFPFIGIGQQLSPTVPQWVSDLGSSTDTCKVVAQKIDGSNNIYVTGTFTGTVDFDPSPAVKNLTSAGKTDVYVAKYNSSGALVWAYSIGGIGIDQPSGLAIDGSGNVTITGQYNSPIMDADPGAGVSLLTNTGGNDMFAINLDANGAFLWAKSIGGTGADIGNGVSIDQTGNRVVVGQYQSAVAIGTNIFTAAGLNGGICAKYDPSGTLLWAFSLGQTGDNGIHAVTTDGNGNVVIAGAFSGTVNFNPLGVANNQTAGTVASFIAEYTPAGQLMWVQPVLGDVAGYDWSICVDLSNNIYVTGPFSGGLTLGPSTVINSTGTQDAFLARYNSSGILSFGEDFAKGNTAKSKTTSQGIIVGSDGNIYVTGYFSGSANFDPAGSINLIDHGQQDLFIAKYTSGGFNWWANNFGNGSGCGNVAGLAIELDNTNNIILAGSFCSTINFDFVGCSGYNVTAQSTASDGFITKYVPGASVTENNVITAPLITSLCGSSSPGTIVGSLAFNGAGPPIYQWQMATDSINFSNIAGANGQSYSPPVTKVNIYYRRTATSGNCYLPVISNIVSIKVQPALMNNTINMAVATILCATATPGSISGSTASGGKGAITYQWQSSTDSVNFVSISGATSLNYYQGTVNATTYYQRLAISSGCGPPSVSNVVKTTIQPALDNNVLTPPAVTFFCGSGIPGAISGSIPTGGNGVYTYQWQSSTDGVTYTTIQGANAQTYTAPAINVTTYYQRVITSGVCLTPLFSNVVTIQVEPAIVNNILTAPPVTDFCTSGQPNTIVGSVPSGGKGTYTYQWQISTDSVNFTDILGITSKDYAPPILYNITYYRRTVTSGSCPLPSNIITIIIQTPIINNTILLATTSCLISGNVPSGGNGHFTYQWQSSVNGVTFADVSSAIAKDYSPPLTNATMYYRRVAMSGTCYPSLTSNTIVITVTAPIANNLITAPAIALLCSGSTPATVNGSNPSGGNGSYTYQWQSSTDNIAFTDIPGAILKSYNPVALTVTTYFHRIVMSGVCSIPSVSSSVAIQIQPALANNVITASGASSYCVSGDPGNISGNVPSGGDNVYSYQWVSSTDGVTFAAIAGATSQDYNPPFLIVTTYYQRMIVSGTCTTPFGSNIITIQIQPALSNNIITAPAVTVFCLSGDAASIMGNTPSGGNGVYNYQWQSSTDSITFNDIPGAITSTYDPPQLNVTTYFKRTISSGACTVLLSSNVVTVKIYSMPVASAGTDVAICPGSNTVLNASGGISYQWSPAIGLSNVNTANPTASPLVTTTYTVSVFNGGCTSTASVTVTVVQIPIVNAGADQKIVNGQTVRLNGTITGNNVKYYWSPATYLDNPNSLNPNAIPTKDITYTLNVTSANNCFVVSDDVFIKVYSSIAIPNTFTPNADGINDLWDIPSLAAYPNCQVFVYSRYGALVFKSIGYTKAWDGTYNGKQLPVGTYYYTADLKDGSKIISGWVAVIR
jgi:gliding motility-associated-like protein